jgi:hypothetical protein
VIEQDDEKQSIDDMTRVQAFLADAAVKDAIRRVNDKNFALFKAAKTPDEMLVAHARTTALEELVNELGVVIARGEFHQAARDRRAAGSKKS